VVLLDLVAVVADQIGRFLDIADALEPVLARLVAHQRGEFPAMGPDGVCNLSDQRQPTFPRKRRPRGVRSTGGRNRLLRVFPCALLKSSNQNSRVDRTRVGELRPGSDVLAVDVHRIVAAKCGRRVRNRIVQRSVQVFELLAAERRVSDLRRHTTSVTYAVYAGGILCWGLGVSSRRRRWGADTRLFFLMMRRPP